MYSNQKESICLCCYLQPFLNIAFIYGVEPCIYCNHKDCNSPIHMNKVLKNIYFGLIEFMLWEHVFLSSWQLIPGLNVIAPCNEGRHLFKSGFMLFRTAILVLSFIYASSFTFIRHNKISLDVTLRSKYFFQQKMAQDNKININKIFNLLFIILNCFILWIAIVIAFAKSYKKKIEKFDSKLLFCIVHYGVWINFLIGGISYILILSFVFMWVAEKELNQIFKELALMNMGDENLHFKIEKFMMHHEEFWNWIAQINNKYSYINIMIYIGITSGTSLCYYMYLFMELENVVRYIVLVLTIVLTFFCIIFGLVMSSFAFNMLNTFQDIRIYTETYLHLEQKLKILDFMKRFGKVALVLSIGGFFNINKRFPMKMASTLHSVFSALLKLRGVTHQKADCVQVSTLNNTEIYEDFLH